MEFRDGLPEDDAGLLRRSIDAMPLGLITLNREGVILQTNRFVSDHAPSLRPGVVLRPALERLTHREMVDRLLIRGEITTFPAEPGGTEHHWLAWPGTNDHGEHSMTFWKTDWNGDMNARRAAFTMAASHELRGPLTTLTGFSEILNMDTTNLTPEQVEATRQIETTARHLAVPVDDVFDLSRNSFGELRLNICDVSPGKALDSVVAALRGPIEERGQTLTCEVENDLPLIKADEARTTQMISNLINNASTHNPGGTAIKVKAGIVGDRLAIEVSDDGDGLPFDPPEEAFQTFRRGAATTGDRTGSGIGLSVTKLLIQLHRGEITVDSTPGEGTRFTRWFPVTFRTALTPGDPGPIGTGFSSFRIPRPLRCCSGGDLKWPGTRLTWCRTESMLWRNLMPGCRIWFWPT